MSLFLEARIYHNGMVVAKTHIPRHAIPPTLSFIDEVATSEQKILTPSISTEALHDTVVCLFASFIGIEVDRTGMWARYFCSKE